jgi:hypothetical protein
MPCIVVVDREYSHPCYDQQISSQSIRARFRLTFYWKEAFLEVHHAVGRTGMEFL